MPLKPEDLLELTPDEENEAELLQIKIDQTLRAEWRPGQTVTVPIGDLSWRVVQRVMGNYRILGWQVNPCESPVDGKREVEFRATPRMQHRNDWP